MSFSRPFCLSLCLRERDLSRRQSPLDVLDKKKKKKKDLEEVAVVTGWQLVCVVLCVASSFSSSSPHPLVQSYIFTFHCEIVWDFRNLVLAV